MKKFVKTIQGAIKAMRDAIRKAAGKVVTKALVKQKAARRKLAESRGDFIMDHGIYTVIILVVAAVVIAALVVFINQVLVPLITQKILDFFN